MAFEAAYRTPHLDDHNRIGLGSRGPVSTCKDAALKSKLYMMINSSITGCDPLKKYTINSCLYFQKAISKCNKDGDDNTATQSKGHSMCPP